MNFQQIPEYKYLTASQDQFQNSEIGEFRPFIRDQIGKSLPAVEVGPSFGPIIPKRDGYSTCVIDHAARDQLIEKYKNDVPDTSSIEDVDVVWAGEPLTDLLPINHYSAIVASHLIEHQPDLLGFLKQCGEILSEIGKLYLCIPDRRYCFDAFHSATTTAKILEDNKFRRTKHSFESFYNVASQIRADGKIGWSQFLINNIEYIAGFPKDWLETVDSYFNSYTYIDNHENYFSPSSLCLLIEELGYFGKLNLEVNLVTRPRGSEFLAILSKRNGPYNRSRQAFEELTMSLRLNMLREDAEQIAALAPVFARYGI